MSDEMRETVVQSWKELGESLAKKYESEKAEAEKPFQKHDQGKRRWSLLPRKYLRGVVDVLMMGAKNHGEWNWQKLDDPTRAQDAVERHWDKYTSGETEDDESGLSHLYHIICNCVFLIHYDWNLRGDEAIDEND